MPSKSLKKIVKGGLWVVLATFVTRFSGFIVLPIVARILGPSDLGLFNLVQNTAQTADVLSRVGADVAIHRNGSQYQSIGVEAVGRLFGVGCCLIFGAGSLISAVLLLGREPIALNLLGEARVESWLSLTSLIILLTTIGTPSWIYLVALHDFRTFSIRTTIISIFGAIFTLLSTYLFGLTGAIWSLALIAAFQSIVGWWLTLPVLKEKKIQLLYNEFLTESRNILSFGLPFYASNFLSSFVSLPLLGYVSRVGGIEQLGYLRVAQSLSQFISFLPNAIAPVLISSLSASFAADVNDYRNTKSLHLRSLWVIVLILSLTISFSLELLVPLLFGSTYTQAVLFSRLSVWNTSLQCLSGILTQHLVSSGKTRLIAIIQTTSIVINIAFSIILIPAYSSIGLLLGQAFSIFFTFVASFKPALLDLDVQDRIIVWLLCKTHLILCIVTFLLPMLIVNPLIKVPVMLSIVVPSTFFLISYVFDDQEKASFVRILKNSINTVFRS